MATPEDKPGIITTDAAEAAAFFSSLYTMGALDDVDIYEIVKPDGTKEQMRLGEGLKHFADLIIQTAYPGCAATLLSSGDISKDI